MQTESLLTSVSYSIPSSAMTLLKPYDHLAEQRPVMEVLIHFKLGKLTLEGDWHYMMSVNKHNDTNSFNCHTGRIKIETTFFPALPVDLMDERNDGLMLSIKGNINDGESIGSCSGLIVIDNTRNINGTLSDHWIISFYLYDLQFAYCEIVFKIPVNHGSALPGLN